MTDTKPESPARPCDCDEVQRLRDLVRYCRHQLHEEGLISDDEFTDLLANTPGAVARLEGYDKAIAKLAQAVPLDASRIRTAVREWLGERALKSDIEALVAKLTS